MNPLLLAVAGKPVLHSRSPAIHRSALAKAGIAGQYMRLAVESARQALTVASEIGISGLNVTAPFKEEMFNAVDVTDETAKKIKAVNTVCFRDGKTFGWNTDVFGVQEALRSRGAVTERAKAVVIGAGGAARAAIVGLQQAGASVIIANRTLSKAEALAQEFNCSAVALSPNTLSKALAQSTIIVNVTSTTERIVPPEFITGAHVLLEAHYAHISAMSTDARLRGARVIDGNDWLIFQAALSFEHFTGTKVEADVFRAALLNEQEFNSRRISLIGMMGAGKSTTARVLATLLGWKRVELDELIERHVKKTIHDIVTQDGEAKLREFESAMLKESMDIEPAVLSCGGGTVLSKENRLLLRQESIPVWLWAKHPELARRVAGGEARPLLQGGEPENKLKEIIEHRRAWYAETCRLIVPTESRAPNEIAERIVHESAYLRNR